MALATAIAAIGVGIAGFSAYKSYESSKENNQAQQAAIAAQQEAEKLRKEQMDLDATRRRREVLRSSIAARSASLAVTTAQGAAYEGGSSLPGAYGSISGRAGVNAAGINQNQELGTGIFDAHQDQLAAYGRAANAQSKQAMWQGLGSLGGAIINNAGTIGQIGEFASGKVGQLLAPKGGYTGFTSFYK